MTPTHIQNRQNFCAEAMHVTIHRAGGVIIPDESSLAMGKDSH
jgi:hypothetical protein